MPAEDHLHVGHPSRGRGEFTLTKLSNTLESFKAEAHGVSSQAKLKVARLCDNSGCPCGAAAAGCEQCVGIL